MQLLVIFPISIRVLIFVLLLNMISASNPAIRLHRQASFMLMMGRVACLIALFWATLMPLAGQTVFGGECFLEGDPGVANGTTFTTDSEGKLDLIFRQKLII